MREKKESWEVTFLRMFGQEIVTLSPEDKNLDARKESNDDFFF